MARHGRTREMGLGPLALVSLAEARDKALACRRLLLDGIDPIEARQRSADAGTAGGGEGDHVRGSAPTATSRRMRRDGRTPSTGTSGGRRWTSPAKPWATCRSQRGHRARPQGAGADLDTKPETASRLRGRIEAVLDWATGARLPRPATTRHDGAATSTSCCRKPPSCAVQHHPALPYADLPQFMAELRANDSISARALEFTILTACRTGEVINASWSEIDLRAKAWTIPAERMKAGKEHRVPLCRPRPRHPVRPAA